MQQRPRISVESSKSSKGGSRRESWRRASLRAATPTVAPVGTPVELGHLQQAREFLDEIRQDVLGGTGEMDIPLAASPKGGEMAMSHTRSIGEMPRPEAQRFTTAAQRLELQRRLLSKGNANEEEMERLAELCCKMHFFKRLTRQQLLHFLAASEFFEKDTAEIIYRDGDPLGYVYVVLNGSVVIHRALREDAADGGKAGACRAFVSSCFDGRAFGDGWDYAGKGSVRCTTAVAQEKSFILRLDTETYREVLRQGDVCSDHAAALRELPFLQECSANELESLLLMLETVTFHYLSRVLEPHQQPVACHVLRQGRCEIRAFGIEVRELLPGAFFGLGVLLGTPYGARKGIEILVSSMTAQFYFIKRKSLLPLPDIVQDTILKRVRELVDAQQDPIQEDGREVTRLERKWRKQKLKSLAEVRRTSAKRKAFKATARVWHPPGQARPLERPVSAVGPEPRDARPALARPQSAPALGRSLKSKGSGTSLGTVSSPQGAQSPFSDTRKSLSSSRGFSMSRQISCATPNGRHVVIPAFADDGRPMAVFGRTSEGFVMLSYPAPLSPLYAEIGETGNRNE